MQVKHLKHFKYTLAVSAVAVAFALFIIATGQTGLLLGMTPSIILLAYFAVERFLQEAQNVFFQVKVSASDGVGYSLNDIIVDVVQLGELGEEERASLPGEAVEKADEEWWVVYGEKTIVLTPALCYHKTDRFLGLVQMLTLWTWEELVTTISNGKTFAVCPSQDGGVAETVLSKVGELSYAYQQLQQKLAAMYSPQYVRMLEGLISKLQDQFEKSVLAMVETGHVPRVKPPLARSKLTMAAAAVAAALLLLLLIVVVL